MKFLYVARCGLPNTAPGIRIYNIALLLKSLGHEVVFMCVQENEDKTGDVVEYEGFKYLFDDFKKRNKYIKKLINYVDLVFANRTYKRILLEINSSNYDGIILY